LHDRLAHSQGKTSTAIVLAFFQTMRDNKYIYIYMHVECDVDKEHTSKEGAVVQVFSEELLPFLESDFSPL
jgi:hypothetical protein